MKYNVFINYFVLESRKKRERSFGTERVAEGGCKEQPGVLGGVTSHLVKRVFLKYFY